MRPMFRKSRLVFAILLFGIVLSACQRVSNNSAFNPNTVGTAVTPTTRISPPDTVPSARVAPDTAPSASSSATGATETLSADSETSFSSVTGAAGTAIESTVVTSKITAALLADSNKGFGIFVDSKNDDVVLTGSVDSQAQNDNALRIAREINSVKNIVNQRTVKVVVSGLNA